MNLEFSIRSWSAWSPGLTEPDHWMAWAAQPALTALTEGMASPEVRPMPALTRRRLSPLGRSAVHVMYDVRGQREAGAALTASAAEAASAASATAMVPVVLGSRYGDAARSLDLLAEMVRGEPLSPAAFGLSVHNAIGALYSMACGDKANYLSIAAGAATAAACLVEAAGLLADGAPEVLVVCYDAPLPARYAEFHDEAAAPCAWAWRVMRPVAGQPRWRLACTAASAHASEAAPGLHADADTAGLAPCGAALAAGLPFGVAMLQAVVSGAGVWQRTVDGRTWRLTRHA